MKLWHIGIKHYLLVEAMDIYFQEHLALIVGESGSGKSLIFDVMKMMVSGKSKVATEDTEIALTFTTDLSCPQAELVVTRRFGKRKVITVNGKKVTQKEVQELLEGLVEINTQFETLTFFRGEALLRVLDTEVEQELLEKVRATYTHVTSLQQQLQTLQQQSSTVDLEYLTFQKEDLQSLQLDAETEAELQNIDPQYHQHQQQLLEIRSILQSWSNDQIYDVAKSLGKYQVQPQIVEEIQGIYYQLEEYRERLLEEYPIIDDRRYQYLLSLQNTLAPYYKRYRCDSLVQKLRDIEDIISQYHSSQLDIQHLHRQIAEATARYQAAAEELQAARKSVAESLSSRVLEHTADVYLAECRLQWEFSTGNPSVNGSDRVQLLVSFNAQLPVTPITESASGGELSRLFLLFQLVLPQMQRIIFFDEVDSGISGKMVMAVSQKLREIAQYHQIVAISHSAIFLAHAQEVFLVEKQQHSVIRKLTTSEIIEHLSWLMYGSVDKEKLLLSQHFYQEHQG